MLLTKGTTRFLIALLLCGISSAAPSSERRDDSDSATDEALPSLEPVLPPDINPDSFSILALDPNVTLAWAGSNSGLDSGRQVLKRDGGIYSQAALTFRYPIIPLDHSSFIADISCSAGSLTGTLSDNAYAFARKQWEKATDILFVTSVDGCGMDNQNDFFHATSVTFSDAEKKFTAKGSPVAFKTVVVHMNLKWGDIGTMRLQRAVNKRDMFEHHSIYERSYASVTVDWDYYLSRPDILGEAEGAPWEDAALLWKWGKEGGKADDSWTKGKVAPKKGSKNKRGNDISSATTELETRGVDYGLALYCVECGFGGSATIWGEIDVSFSWTLQPSLDIVQVGFNGDFKAGLNLGMVAYVKYEKEWSTRLARIPLSGFNIPLIVDVGPFVSVSVEAGVEIGATGSLLIGTSVVWDDIDIMLDLLSPSNSHSLGMTPKFENRVEASGEVKVEAKLGMPFRLGVGISLVGGVWEAEAAIENTPKVVAEGKFEVSSKIVNGQIKTDMSDGCYGIGWDIHFENELKAVMEGDIVGSTEFDLIEPQKSEPIAEGCIGYVREVVKKPTTTKKTTAKPTSTKKPTTTAKTTTKKATAIVIPKPTITAKITAKPTSKKPTTTAKSTKPASTCIASSTATPNPKAPDAVVTCKKTFKQASVANKFKLGKVTKPKDVGLCALNCLKDERCYSFTYGDDRSCQLYTKIVRSLAVTATKGEPQLTFYDWFCYAANKCKK